MSNLMKLLGTILALLGVVLGVMIFTQSARMQVYGIQLDTAAFLLVGGILAVGLGGVIDTFRASVPRKEILTVGDASVRAKPVTSTPATNVKPFRKPTEAEAATEVVATAVASVAGISSDEANAAVAGATNQVSDTINALEQAKQDIMKSMSGLSSTTETDTQEDGEIDRPGPEDRELIAEPSQSGAEGLFVLEEKVIRGRPARVLSDDTIEAETDEGWMRFEDFDHLNEYLDSMEEQAG